MGIIDQETPKADNQWLTDAQNEEIKSIIDSAELNIDDEKTSTALDNKLKGDISNYRQAILNGEITKKTGGKINSKVITAAIDRHSGKIY